MGRLMFSENGKWLIRNYGGRRIINKRGELRRYVDPGEIVMLDRSSKPNGELPDLEILEDPNPRRLSTVLNWLATRQTRMVLLAFALGAWSIWTALTMLMLFQ